MLPLPLLKSSLHSAYHLANLQIFPPSIPAPSSSKSLRDLEKEMLGKQMVSLKKLAKKVKAVGGADPDPVHCECLLKVKRYEEESPSNKTPTGFFALYVGEERQRYVVPTSYLSHPLFKMLLEKAYDEYGFEQRNGLVVPCSVSTFQEVLNAIECCNGKFDLGKLFEEFL